MFSEALSRAVGQWPGAKLLDHVCVESSILGKLLPGLLPPPPILGLTPPQSMPLLLRALEKGGKTQPSLLLLIRVLPQVSLPSLLLQSLPSYFPDLFCI